MTWSAEIVDKIQDDGLLTVVVRYTDGAKVVQERVQTKDPNGDWPMPDIQARLKSLELVSTKPIRIGAITPVVEKPADPAIAAYGQLIMRARHLKRMAELGVKSGDADLIEVLAQLEAGYKPEYESLF